MPASPPEGTRDARLVVEDEAEKPPPSSSAHRRPTTELGADIYQRATAPGEYPALARERSIHEARTGGAAASVAVEAYPAPEPGSDRPRLPLSDRPRAPPSDRPRPPASDRPRARLTEPIGMAYAPSGPVLPFAVPGRMPSFEPAGGAPSFEPAGRAPSSPSRSFGPISAMTLQARTSLSFSERPAAAPPQTSRLRKPAAGLLLALGVAGLVVLLARQSAAPAPVVETPVAAVVAPVAAPALVTARAPEPGTAQESPAATAGVIEPAPTGPAIPRSAGWKPTAKTAAPTEPVAPPPSVAPTSSARARHRLFDTEN